MADGRLQMLRRLPHTPEGDAEFLRVLRSINGLSYYYEKLAEAELHKRPSIYEDLARYLIGLDRTIVLK